MIVFLTEEPSIKPVILRVLSDLWETSHEGIDWQIITHQGKADLEANMVRKMSSWNYNNPHFIILRDNDGAVCTELKSRLSDRVIPSGKPHHIRLVCQELEAWFLGDLPAVEAAYPNSKACQHTHRQPYRIPDSIGNASQMLETLTGVSGKVNRSQRISLHLNVNNNRSTSFRVFYRTLATLISQHS